MTQKKRNVTYLFDTHTTKFMSNKYSFLNTLPSNIRTQKSTSKSITSTISINNLIIFQRINRENLCFGFRSDNKTSIFRTMCENNNTFTRFIGFFISSERFCDSGKIGFGTWIICCCCPCFSFGFVTDDDIGVRKDLFKV